MKLSEHFTLKECCKSSTATRLGIQNAPNGPAINAMVQTCQNVLEPIRATFGPFTPNSFYRGLELNRALGSKDSSQHVTGEAVDVEVSGTSNLALAEWIRENLDFDQLLLEFHTPGDPSSGWVHVSWFDGQRRNEVLTITSDGAFPGLPSDRRE